jgi:hypothetical protein
MLRAREENARQRRFEEILEGLRNRVWSVKNENLEQRSM